MAELHVEVCEIASVSPHPNADRLEVAVIKGWQTIVPKGQFKAGQLVVYFPPDVLLPQVHTDAFGVTQYCQPVDGMLRVRKTRLRGEPSFGFAVPVPDPFMLPGVDLADAFGAKKYQPPTLGLAGDILGGGHPAFLPFTDIENLRHYPDLFQDGEPVVATEKIHGTQVRLAWIDGQIMAGSKSHARKTPATDDDAARNFYWSPVQVHRKALEGVFSELGQHRESVMVFGETYGRVQSLRYGLNSLAFRAFDVAVCGKYLDFYAGRGVLERNGVPVVPIIYQGPYVYTTIQEVAEGNTQVAAIDQIREGVVVRPMVERSDPRVGRVIAKYVSNNYLFGKDADLDTTDA
jgi:RNA ligase (TIGR02306 family)